MTDDPAKLAHHRWSVFSSAWVLILIISSIAMYSVFSEPLTQLRGWSLGSFNLAYSIYTLIQAVTAIFAGMYMHKHGTKKMMYVGGFTIAAGWFLTSFASSIPAFYITFGIVAGAGSGILYNPSLVTALKWFPEQSGRISGLLLSSAAIGPFLFSPVAAKVIELFGVLNAFRIFGVSFLILAWAVAWKLDSAPEGYRPPGFRPSKSSSQTKPKKININWKVMVSSPLFYLLLVTMIVASTAGTMLVSSVSVIAQQQIGLTASLGAIIVSVSTLSNFIGRLSFGVLFEKMGAFGSLVFDLLITISALLLIAFADTLAVFVVCIVLLGFSFGGVLVLFPPLTGQLFGLKYLEINYAIVFLGYAGGAFVGPRIAAYFSETAGSFIPAYFVAAALSAIGLILVGLLALMARKQLSNQKKLVHQS
ncbi:OFA family MFS transporter [Sporolactobacillus sp. THM19-2]|uniref:L-lactate MFS transporter n=1 Tax=Sporolactobacillus sp. THM19-2 TaxID=2511171 RepID=UPI001020E2C2|nr:OFA family MFS transporter [Sporolactobacillus sp. THM19-2]RYL89280.1 MFS transporter [Sporolactobacillus sp. THM19-2]